MTSSTAAADVFRAVYRQVMRFLAWVNRGSSYKAVVDHRRDMESRTGGRPGPD
jgi:hypothetical protein